MKIDYVREMNRNYLRAEPECGCLTEYTARMLENNQIRGLLPMRISYRDGAPVFCYDITSRQPLGRLFGTRMVTGEEIQSFLEQLGGTVAAMRGYLLEDEGLLLEPDLIYADPESFSLGFCLVPGEKRDFLEQLRRMLQYFLRYVDHRDRECVVMAYGLYQESLRENCGMERLLWLAAGGGAQKKPEGEKRRESAPAADAGREERARPEEMEGKSGRPETGKEETADRLPPRTGRPRTGRQAAAVLLPGSLWLFGGRELVLRYRYLLAAGTAALAAGMLLWNLAVFLRDGQAAGNRAVQGEVLPEAETEEGADFWGIPARSGAVDTRRETEEGPQEQTEEGMPPGGLDRRGIQAEGNMFQTVLLNAQETEGARTHLLSSVRPETEDIPVPYYPFIIGKNRDLADYVLDRETVSRFHLRIDREGERVFVTDLNSTNGTQVGGRLLAANETAELYPGDEVVIADMAYIWRGEPAS